jgi:hypothetical protein
LFEKGINSTDQISELEDDMGWFFQMSIECGEDQSSAQEVARHFEGFSFALSETKNTTCSTGTISDADQNQWAIVCPSGLSHSGINTEEDSQQMTMAGRHLYERLLSAPAFRYALAGVETEEFRSFTELKEIEASLYPRLHGLVMSHEIWEILGSPSGFVEFRDGYLWLPYLGETPPSR